MKKLLLGLIFFMLAFSVSAWHCVDTDEKKPVSVNGLYGPWGDNGLLEGTSTGWTDGNLYDGCTGSYNSATCKDYCMEYDLIEFYCDDRPNHTGETIIKWIVHENSDKCGYEVPEFGTLAAGVALIGALGIFAFTRRK